MERKATLSVVPDGLFGLVFSDESAAYFVLEVDRGTIQLLRKHMPGTPVEASVVKHHLDRVELACTRIDGGDDRCPVRHVEIRH
jgi:hypothetical protein